MGVLLLFDNSCHESGADTGRAPPGPCLRGDGMFRGGLGQSIEIGAEEGHEFDFSAMFDRIAHPARGREGGRDGQAGAVTLSDGTAMRGKGWQHVPAGRRLRLELPGGGGLGDPEQRSEAARNLDRIRGYSTENNR